MNFLHKKGYINKDNYIDYIDKYFTFQRLGGGGSIGDVDFLKRKNLNVFTKNLAFQMRVYNFGNVLKSCVPSWFMLQQDIQILFNFFFSNFVALFG